MPLFVMLEAKGCRRKNQAEIQRLLQQNRRNLAPERFESGKVLRVGYSAEQQNNPGLTTGVDAQLRRLGVSLIYRIGNDNEVIMDHGTIHGIKELYKAAEQPLSENQLIRVLLHTIQTYYYAGTPVDQLEHINQEVSPVGVLSTPTGSAAASNIRGSGNAGAISFCQKVARIFDGAWVRNSEDRLVQFNVPGAVLDGGKGTRLAGTARAKGGNPLGGIPRQESGEVCQGYRNLTIWNALWVNYAAKHMPKIAGEDYKPTVANDGILGPCGVLTYLGNVLSELRDPDKTPEGFFLGGHDNAELVSEEESQRFGMAAIEIITGRFVQSGEKIGRAALQKNASATLALTSGGKPVSETQLRLLINFFGMSTNQALEKDIEAMLQTVIGPNATLDQYADTDTYGLFFACVMSHSPEELRANLGKLKLMKMMPEPVIDKILYERVEKVIFNRLIPASEIDNLGLPGNAVAALFRSRQGSQNYILDVLASEVEPTISRLQTDGTITPQQANSLRTVVANSEKKLRWGFAEFNRGAITLDIGTLPSMLDFFTKMVSNYQPSGQTRDMLLGILDRLRSGGQLTTSQRTEIEELEANLTNEERSDRAAFQRIAGFDFGKVVEHCQIEVNPDNPAQLGVTTDGLSLPNDWHGENPTARRLDELRQAVAGCRQGELRDFYLMRIERRDLGRDPRLANQIWQALRAEGYITAGPKSLHGNLSQEFDGTAESFNPRADVLRRNKAQLVQLFQRIHSNKVVWFRYDQEGIKTLKLANCYIRAGAVIGQNFMASDSELGDGSRRLVFGEGGVVFGSKLQTSIEQEPVPELRQYDLTRSLEALATGNQTMTTIRDLAPNFAGNETLMDRVFEKVEGGYRFKPYADRIIAEQNIAPEEQQALLKLYRASTEYRVAMPNGTTAVFTLAGHDRSHDVARQLAQVTSQAQTTEQRRLTDMEKVEAQLGVNRVTSEQLRLDMRSGASRLNFTQGVIGGSDDPGQVFYFDIRFEKAKRPQYLVVNTQLEGDGKRIAESTAIVSRQPSGNAPVQTYTVAIDKDAKKQLLSVFKGATVGSPEMYDDFPFFSRFTMRSNRELASRAPQMAESIQQLFHLLPAVVDLPVELTRDQHSRLIELDLRNLVTTIQDFCRTGQNTNNPNSADNLEEAIMWELYRQTPIILGQYLSNALRQAGVIIDPNQAVRRLQGLHQPTPDRASRVHLAQVYQQLGVNDNQAAQRVVQEVLEKCPLSEAMFCRRDGSWSGLPWEGLHHTIEALVNQFRMKKVELRRALDPKQTLDVPLPADTLPELPPEQGTKFVI